MNSKIIKISFILLCMLFVTGLYNFCFAYTLGEDFKISNTINLQNRTISFADLNFEFNELDVEYTDIFYYINTNLNTFGAYVWNQDVCLLPDTNGSILQAYPASNLNSTSAVWYSVYIYDINKGVWNSSSSGSSISMSNRYIVNPLTIPIYDYSKNLVYEGYKDTTPSDEELIANCDFRVSFKFAPDSADFPSDNISTRWSWPCKLLVEHFLTNWEDNYNVKVNLSVVNKTQPNGLYYDLYNSDGEEIQKKKHIKEEILTESIDFGDFFLFFTDNLQDTFKFEYEIYNKSDELLMKKIYTFKFTKSGLTAFNSTGTIMSENIQDSTGQDIENGKNSFDTNGYDNTSTDNDFYDVSNLDNLASSASDTINLAKKCFEILPGFIWVMVGVFLSVCIALRILGR